MISCCVQRCSCPSYGVLSQSETTTWKASHRLQFHSRPPRSASKDSADTGSMWSPLAQQCGSTSRLGATSLRLSSVTLNCLAMAPRASELCLVKSSFAAPRRLSKTELGGRSAQNWAFNLDIKRNSSANIVVFLALPCEKPWLSSLIALFFWITKTTSVISILDISESTYVAYASIYVYTWCGNQKHGKPKTPYFFQAKNWTCVLCVKTRFTFYCNQSSPKKTQLSAASAENRKALVATKALPRSWWRIQLCLSRFQVSGSYASSIHIYVQ